MSTKFNTTMPSTVLPSQAHQRAVVALLRAADTVRREIESVMQSESITGQQYNVLRILRGAAEAGEGPLPTMEVAARMIESEPGITRMMGRLETKGLVHRSLSQGDARQKLCSLTEAGRNVVDALDAPVQEANARLVGPLNEEQVEALIDLLGVIQRPSPAAG